MVYSGSGQTVASPRWSGVILLVAIVLLLAITAGTMIKTTAEQQPEEPSIPAVTFDENRFNVQVTAHSSIQNAEHLEIKVNGETRRT